MNSHHPPSPRGGLHRFIRLFSLLLVQHALMPSVIDARSRLPGNPDGDRSSEPASLPYLKVAGAPSLRFRAAPPPPDLTSKPPAAGSPHPAPVKAVSAEPDVTMPAAEPVKVVKDSTPEPTGPVTNKPALTILPDDTRSSTRPEDFLPFFQFPGASSELNAPARPPSQGQLPPSSATYQQR